MKSTLTRFTQLRVYKNMKTSDIINSIVCNRIMKNPILVKNSRNLYEVSSKVLSKTFVDYVLTQTFCKTLTAGNTLK